MTKMQTVFSPKDRFKKIAMFAYLCQINWTVSYFYYHFLLIHPEPRRCRKSFWRNITFSNRKLQKAEEELL